MSDITVTNTFSNGAIADGTQVNTNFADVTNGLTLGNRDITVRNGNITSATVSSLVHTGSSLGFYGQTPVSQAVAITAPTGLTTVVSAVNSIIAVLQNLGLTA